MSFIELVHAKKLQAIQTNSSIQLISFSTFLNINDTDLIRLYDKWESDTKFYYKSENKKLLAFGNVHEFKNITIDEIENLKLKIDEINENIVSLNDVKQLYWVGGKSFFGKKLESTIWNDWNFSHFFLPQITLIGRGGNEYQIIIINQKCDVEEFEGIIQLKINEINQKIQTSNQNGTMDPTRNLVKETTEVEWNEYIKKALLEITRDNIEKVVLSGFRQYQVELSNFSRIILCLNKKFPNAIVFDFQIKPEVRFFGASPELLIGVQDNTLYTYALAGSIPRGTNVSDDELLSKKLLNSEKNLMEHKFVVDDIISQLNSVSNQITFDHNPSVVKLDNIQHLKTKIKGQINSEAHILQIMNVLHPTPALAGKPTSQAVELIHSIEKHERGWYGSPIGWFSNNGDGEFVVSIRSALLKSNLLTLYAGAGIVKGSNQTDEWNEINTKYKAIEGILGFK